MPSFEDLTGKRLGYLTVLHRAPDRIQPSGQHKRMWHCLCICGKECDVRASDLKSGNTTSCGCQSSRKKSVGLEDLTGKQFGDFLVINRAANRITPSGQQTRVWHCRCVKCDVERDIQASQLKHFSGKCSCVLSPQKLCVRMERDLTNQTFGQLTVNQFDKRINGRKYWLCTCKCGQDNISVDEYRLLKGKKISCGCASRKASVNKNVDKAKKSIRSLMLVNPELAAEWHPVKNGALMSSEVYPNSKIKVWWLGKCGHEWEASVESRSSGSGCPICSKRITLKGYNDFATLYPELLPEWDYEKNLVNPEEALALNTLVWWKCKLGHSYDMRIASRVGKQKCGCPYCSVPAKKILKGFNDLATTHPQLLVEWDYEKNDVNPEEISFGSARKVWWKCKNGHSFEQTIVYKATSKLKSTCPYCSHQRLLTGYNDLATTHAYILDEWDYQKNSFLPTQVGVGTHEKVWWKCPFGHSYQAYPSNRCGKMRSGCPICDKENHTSFPEQAVLFYVKRFFPDAINSDRERIGMELDILIPNLNIAIEYDGKTWHNNNAYEAKKNKVCKEKNVLLVRIREEGLILYDDCVCLVRKNIRSNDSLSEVIRELLKLIDNIEADIDVDRDASSIYSSYIETRKSKSLATLFPEIAKEWHPTQNGNLTTEMVAPMSNKKVWWLGECGHEWQMSIEDRTNQKCGCPICAGKRIVSGINDLLTKYPTLCEEWFYEKNDEIRLFPDKVAIHSDKKAWWKCGKCGYVWQSKIDSRTRMKSGCPECGKQTISAAKYKAVICIESGVRYISLKDAQEKTGISSHCIANCCKGKQKTAGKLHWKFCDK